MRYWRSGRTIIRIVSNHFVSETENMSFRIGNLSGSLREGGDGATPQLPGRNLTVWTVVTVGTQRETYTTKTAS